MGVSGQRHSPVALYPRGNTPSTHTGGSVGPRAGMDAGTRKKILCPCRGLNLNRPARSQTLYWLSYRGSENCIKLELMYCNEFLYPITVIVITGKCSFSHACVWWRLYTLDTGWSTCTMSLCWVPQTSWQSDLIVSPCLMWMRVWFLVLVAVDVWYNYRPCDDPRISVVHRILLLSVKVKEDVTMIRQSWFRRHPPSMNLTHRFRRTQVRGNCFLPSLGEEGRFFSLF
jgi:hypothetical protein